MTKLGQAGSGSKMPSPGSVTATSAAWIACPPPLPSTTCCGSTENPLRDWIFSANAARSSGMPAVGV